MRWVTGCLAKVSLAVIFSAGVLQAQSLTRVSTAGAGGGTVGFPIEQGRLLVTIGGHGAGLAQVRPEAGRWTVLGADPASRLVVMKAGGATGGPAYAISGGCQVGQVLQEAGSGRAIPVVGRVQQVSGAYLPFTVFKVRVQPLPATGTPLLDQAGRVAGVVSDPAGNGEVYVVPGEVVSRVVDDLADHGRRQSAWLGIAMSPRERRPVVTRVSEGSPAAAAGVEAGDVLMAVGSRGVSSYADAVNVFFLTEPGDQVRVRVNRGGQVKELPLTAAAR